MPAVPPVAALPRLLAESLAVIGRFLMSASEHGFAGRWRIVDSEVWDSDTLDLAGPAEVSFEARQRGVLRLLGIRAEIDYRVVEIAGRARVEFTWMGDDEGTMSCGRGFAERDGERLRGELFIHQGDDSSFEAVRKEAKRRKGSDPASAAAE